MTWPQFSDINAKVRSFLNEPIEAFWTDEEIGRYINDGERDIASKTLCIQNVQPLSTAAYATDFRKVSFSGYTALYVEYIPTSGRPIGLEKILPKQMGRMSFTSGPPQYWFQWGQWVIIDPLPLAEYALNVYAAIPPTSEMSAPTDVPQISAEFHEDIVTYAVYRALWKSKKWGQSALAYQEYIASIQRKHIIYVADMVDNKYKVLVPESIENTADGKKVAHYGR